MGKAISKVDDSYEFDKELSKVGPAMAQAVGTGLVAKGLAITAGSAVCPAAVVPGLIVAGAGVLCNALGWLAGKYDDQ